MRKNLTKRQSGFTIIEVLIVLAIAGLILLVVFLAVPGLQRNSRNTTIKNDASGVAGGISEYESNNDGTAPTSVSGTGTVVLHSAAAGTTDTSAKVQGSTAVTTVSSAPTAPAPAPGNIQVYPGHNCAGGASARAFAIYYSIENSSSTAQQKCLDT